MADDTPTASPRDKVLHHVRRYPRWYAAGAIWALAMTLLPVVELDALPIFGSPTAPTATPTGGSTPTGDNAGDDVAAPPAGSSTPTAPAATSTTPPTSSGTTLPPELLPPEEVPPDFIDELFNMIPPPQALPDVPPALQPVVRAVSPLATNGCTGLGLASLVVAVVAPSAEGIPLERILPYLSPVTSACANFPIPEQHTVCAADEPLVQDIGGVTESPPILGLGIDQLTAIEDIMIERFGAAFPRISDTARRLLDCELVE